MRVQRLQHPRNPNTLPRNTALQAQLILPAVGLLRLRLERGLAQQEERRLAQQQAETGLPQQRRFW